MNVYDTSAADGVSVHDMIGQEGDNLMTEKLTDSVIYVGTDDPDIDLFEGQYKVKNGMAYNSYLIDGPVTCLMDGVDERKKDEWFENVQTALNGRKLDYMVVQHLEPDHSGSIEAMVKLHPETKFVMSKKAKSMVPNFFDTDFANRIIEVGEGDTLELDGRKLHFVTAPMVHWPEVIMSYDDKDKILFAADAFGKFGMHNLTEDWDDEARRYFINIVGKYGPQVQAVLKKAAGLDIDIVAPLHGPYLKGDAIAHAVDKYQHWSSYTPEEDGVFIAVASAHGHTKEAAEKMAEILRDKGAKVCFMDLNREDVHEAVARCYQYPKIILAANSYDAGVFPPMERLCHILSHKNFQNREIGIIQNGSWAPSAARTIKEILSKCKNLTFAEPEILITTSMRPANVEQMKELADNLLKKD